MQASSFCVNTFSNIACLELLSTKVLNNGHKWEYYKVGYNETEWLNCEPVACNARHALRAHSQRPSKLGNTTHVALRCAKWR